MRKLSDFLVESEFYLKVAVGCTLIQQAFYWLLYDTKLSFVSQVLLYWVIGSGSFYSISFLIEKIIKNNCELKEKLNVRAKKVKKQPFPTITGKGIISGEVKGFIAVLIILYIAPEVHRGGALLTNLEWFLMRIIFADLCFYIAHWLLHRRFLQKIHLKHHQFRDTSSFVAGHKSLLEYIIVTITDLLPIFIFGYDITQLSAWTSIGNAYNIEGHSSSSIFFISSDFHDLHHTCFQGNYGIQGFWDRVFNTLNPPTQKPGIVFPTAFLQKMIMKQSNSFD